MCYYDSTNQKLIRWKWPEPGPYLIILWIGWAGFGVFGILGIGVIICMCYRQKTNNYNELP